MVQARWDHLNERGVLADTRPGSPSGRPLLWLSRGGATGAAGFFKFNGTAGMWRKDALWRRRAAGTTDTLTEDLDISYRVADGGMALRAAGRGGRSGRAARASPASLLVQQRQLGPGRRAGRTQAASPRCSAAPLAPRRSSWRPSVHLCGQFAYPLTFCPRAAHRPGRACQAHSWAWTELWWLGPGPVRSRAAGPVHRRTTWTAARQAGPQSGGRPFRRSGGCAGCWRAGLSALLSRVGPVPGLVRAHPGPVRAGHRRSGSVPPGRAMSPGAEPASAVGALAIGARAPTWFCGGSAVAVCRWDTGHRCPSSPSSPSGFLSLATGSAAELRRTQPGRRSSRSARGA